MMKILTRKKQSIIENKLFIEIPISYFNMDAANMFRIQTNRVSNAPNLGKISHNIREKCIFGLFFVARQQRCEIIISPKNVWHSLMHQVYLLIQFNKDRFKYLLSEVPDTELPKINTSDDILQFYRVKFEKTYKNVIFKRWLLDTPFSDERPEDDADIKKMMFLGAIPNSMPIEESIHGTMPAINISGELADWDLLYEKVGGLIQLVGHLPSYRITKWQNDLFDLINAFKAVKQNNVDVNFWSNLATPSNTMSLTFLEGHMTALQRFLIDRSGPVKTLIERDGRILIDDLHEEYTVNILKINNRAYKLCAGASGLVTHEKSLYLGTDWTLTGV